MVPGQKQASSTALEKLKADGQIAATQLAQFNQLKNKLIKIYQMQGFKSMVKSNPNMSRFLGVVRQDLIREEGKDDISAQITGRSVNMMEFSRMIEKLRYVHTQQQRDKDNWNKKPEFKVNIQYDKSSKNIGVLIRLNNLMKRLELVKHLTGDWKSTNNKYSTVTEQVKYVRKKLELLDEAKILFLQNRAEKLNQEVKATW